MSISVEPKCFQMHLGPWMVEPNWFANAKRLFLERPEAFEKMTAPHREEIASVAGKKPEGRYLTTIYGKTAVIRLRGYMSKSSKFGTSTVELRQDLRAAVADKKVDNILLYVDSPGGTVDGMADLARDIRNASATKRMVSYIDGLGASAAYWAASQTSEIYANEMSEIGSIGTYTILEDTSGAYEAKGIKVYLISTGPFKGATEDGVAISEEVLDYLRERVTQFNSFFLKAISLGRRMSDEQVKTVADGRVWLSNEAKALNLIDGVTDFEEVLGDMMAAPAKAMRSESTRLRLRLLSLSD